MYNPFLPYFRTYHDVGAYWVGKKYFYLGKSLLPLNSIPEDQEYLHYYNLGWVDSFNEQN